MAGGLTGSLLLMFSSDDAFAALVPFLLLLATLAFMFGDQIRDLATRTSGAVRPFGSSGLFVVSIYGGYFNGGLGIVLLALFALWGMTRSHVMNGLKSGLSFVLSAVSVATFAFAGLVEWRHTAVMMLASTAGGYIGAPIARALPPSVIQAIIVVIGFSMSAIFLARLGV